MGRESLLRRLIEKAESAGGEEWLLHCLEAGQPEAPPEPSFSTAQEKMEESAADMRSPRRQPKRAKKKAREEALQCHAGRGRARSAPYTKTPPRQERAQPAVATSNEQTRSLPMDPPKYIIWIVGHSYVYWAERLAASRSYSSNLGLDFNKFKILWSGVRGLRWRNLRDHLLYLSSIWPAPVVLVIHLGANDIGKVRTWELLCEMKNDFCAIKLLFPRSILAFSEMVPRLLWSPWGNFFYVDKIRRRLNRTIHNFLASSGSLSFRHLELEGFIPGLFREDLVHLSDIGIDIFSMGLQSLIENAMVLGGPQPAAALLASVGGE